MKDLTLVSMKPVGVTFVFDNIEMIGNCSDSSTLSQRMVPSSTNTNGGTAPSSTVTVDITAVPNITNNKKSDSAANENVVGLLNCIVLGIIVFLFIS